MKKGYYYLVIVLIVVLGLKVYLRFGEYTTHRFEVTFFNIGQGDSALIQFRNGEKMLVDCGPNKTILTKLGQTLPFYDRSIDYLVVTHPDLDHYGGCVDVLQRYQVKKIITNGRTKPSDPYWQKWEALRHNEGAVLVVIDGKEDWQIASTTLSFLSPDLTLSLTTAPTDSNNYSIVFRLNDEPTGQSVLFTGDMEELLEKSLLSRYCSSFVSNTTTLVLKKQEPHDGVCPILSAQVLKVGHHGSESSTSKELLDAVAPKIGVVSVGKNAYGHPSLRVLKKLERSGVVIRRTDKEGDIVMQ